LYRCLKQNRIDILYLSLILLQIIKNIKEEFMFSLPKKKEIKVSGRTTEVIRVRNSTLEYVDEMVEESGLSRQEIIDRAVRYAYNDLEWEEE
jgi:hypothetical protein